MKYILIVLLLSGCATTQVVPVAVSCVTSTPSEPSYRYAPGSYAELFPLIQDLKGDRELMIGYAAQLNAVITGCK